MNADERGREWGRGRKACSQTTTLMQKQSKIQHEAKPTDGVNLKSKIDQGLAWVVIVVMAVLVIDVLWQVFTRFVLRDPSSFTEELARYLLIWVGLLGASYAAGQRMHLAVDLLPSKLTGRRKRYLSLVIEGCTLVFAFFALVVGGANLVRVTLLLGQTSAALQVPLGYVYLAVPLSGLLIMFYAAYAMVEQVRALRGASPGASAEAGPSPLSLE